MARITELDAVNQMLACIGESPVESLATEETNTTSDAALALATLREVAREVQSEGWSWNTDFEVELSRTGADSFTLPTSTLRAYFAPERYPGKELVIRGYRVYNRTEQSYSFPDLEKIIIQRLVKELDWDDLPYQAQRYVVMRSARIHAARFVNSDAVVGYTANDEQYARAMLIRDEGVTGNYNILWENRVGAPQGAGYLPRRGRRYRVN